MIAPKVLTPLGFEVRTDCVNSHNQIAQLVAHIVQTVALLRIDYVIEQPANNLLYTVDFGHLDDVANFALLGCGVSGVGLRVHRLVDVMDRCTCTVVIP